MLNDDIEWLVEAYEKLLAINKRIAKMVPENPRLYDPMQSAHIYSAQAASGCERTVKYLKQAVKEAMGGNG